MRKPRNALHWIGVETFLKNAESGIVASVESEEPLTEDDWRPVVKLAKSILKSHEEWLARERPSEGGQVLPMRRQS